MKRRTQFNVSASRCFFFWNSTTKYIKYKPDREKEKNSKNKIKARGDVLFFNLKIIRNQKNIRYLYNKKKGIIYTRRSNLGGLISGYISCPCGSLSNNHYTPQLLPHKNTNDYNRTEVDLYLFLLIFGFLLFIYAIYTYVYIFIQVPFFI